MKHCGLGTRYVSLSCKLFEICLPSRIKCIEQRQEVYQTTNLSSRGYTRFMYHDLPKLLIRYPTAIEGKTIETYEKLALLIIECIFANHLNIDDM